MSRERILAIAMGVALPVVGCTAPGSQFSDADYRANQELANHWLRHLEAKNWDSLSQLYTDNAMFMPPNQPAVRGRAAIREWMGAFPPISHFSLVDDTISGNGDLAYVRGRYQMTLGVEGAQPDSGKFVEVRRRQPDGSWRLEVDIFNSSVPLPPPPAPARRR